MFKTLFSGSRGRWLHSLETTRIGVKGMTTKHCERTVKKALLSKNGVREVYVNRVTGVATVSFDPTLTDIPSLTQVILRKGYFPAPVEELESEANAAG